MNYKKIIGLSICGCLLFTGCQSSKESTNKKETKTIQQDISSEIENLKISSISEEDLNIQIGNDPTIIDLSKENQDIKIEKKGTYIVSGSLKNHSIIVDCENAKVHLILNGITIETNKEAPIYVKKAKEVKITLADQSKNIIKDTQKVDMNKSDVTASIFSKSDLIINGTGSLQIESVSRNGIQGKDIVKMIDGNISISSSNDAIKGKDALYMYKGNYTIEAKGDGIVCSNEEKSDLQLQDVKMKIIASKDGIQANDQMKIYSGTYHITTGGGSVNKVETSMEMDFKNRGFKDFSETNEESSKGIKSTNTLEIHDGNFTISAHDDAIHSNQDIILQNGTYTLSSDDDTIHSDTNLMIEKGTYKIIQSYEGIEADVITINQGNLHVVSSDDGINASGNNSLFTMNDGILIVDANGDGIDSNLKAVMNNGTIVVYGPVNGGNGALDVESNLVVNGGTLIASGSSQMASAPSNESKQASMMISFDSMIEKDTCAYITDEKGNYIMGIKSSKSFNNVIFSSDKITKGNTYTIFKDGKANKEENGLLTNASGGTKVDTITMSDTVTTYGNGGMMNPGNMPNDMGKDRRPFDQDSQPPQPPHQQLPQDQNDGNSL